MRGQTSSVAALLLLAGAAMGASAHAPASSMDAAALQAYADKPWDKATLMHATVDLGRYRNIPVVAEFPCSDVCPQYTVRIIHYRLPPQVSCAGIGGVEKEVLVPVAITVLPKTFCVPEPLAKSGLYYAK